MLFRSGMVSPGGKQEFDMGKVRAWPATFAVEYTFINDYGVGVKGVFDPQQKK